MKNPRHELFAQEVAAGRTKTDGFLEAYPHAAEWKATAVHVKACMLAAREDVKARITHLQAKAADASVFTLAAHLARLNALSISAEKAGDFAPAVRAEENRGKAAGFYPTKVELTGKGGGPIESKQTRDLTKEELEAELKKYGIEP
jgi:phage-related tail fiber protein